MGTSLIGLLPQNTYSGLIKVGDNTAINSSLKTLSDGAGNDLTVQVSSTSINFTGSVGISATSVDASAKLQIDSTTQGLLLPRMTTTQINAISSPAAGLMVYNTTLECPVFRDSTGWRKISHTNM
jgi:hypothetical protein